MKKSVILDSDIGDDICDVLALCFVLNSPELKVEAIISNNGHEKERAQMIQKLVSVTGKEIPVFQGIKGGRGILTHQKAFIKDSRFKPKMLRNNVEFFKKLAKKELYVFESKGCKKCNFSGYSGRIGVFEVLSMTDRLAEIILKEPSENKIIEEAKIQGMTTMKQNGIIKVLEGLTSIEEILRVAEEK